MLFACRRALGLQHSSKRAKSGAATGFSFDGADSLVVNGPDGPTQVQGVWVELPPGAQLDQRVSFRLFPKLRMDAAYRYFVVVDPDASGSPGAPGAW